MLPTLFSEREYFADKYLRYSTLADLWNRNAAECPGKEAISDSEKRLTWGEAKTWIDRLALGLIDRNFGKTDVLAVQLPNCVELNMFRVACERAGCLSLPLNTAFRRNELEYTLKFVKAKGIVIPYEFRHFNYYEMVRELSQHIESLHYIFVVGNVVPDIRRKDKRSR